MASYIHKNGKSKIDKRCKQYISQRSYIRKRTKKKRYKKFCHMKIDYIDPNNYGIVHTVLDESSTGIMLESYKG